MDENDFQSQPLSTRTVRRTYLITYSQTDLQKFPSRESFGTEVAFCFDQGSGKCRVEHWACSLEPHKNTSGYHYHVCIKLSAPKRWNMVKNKLRERHNIEVNFSEGHDHYYSAFKYVTKEDKDFFVSEGHPNLQEIGSPKTKKCLSEYRKTQKQKRKEHSPAPGSSREQETCSSSKKKKPNRSSMNLDVAEFIIKNNIKDTTQLFAVADEQRKEGKKDLASFILGRSPKSLQDLLENAWKLENAKAELEIQNRSRMDVIRNASTQPCTTGCNEEWYKCALEVLRNNSINKYVFAYCMRELISKGRGKGRNLILIGPANCGKTFLFAPVQHMFRTFSNPSHDKYTWQEAENCEVMFMNDFRWSAEIMAWNVLLLLAEGQSVRFLTPKNHKAKDILFTAQVPLFATSKDVITNKDPGESEMMMCRWKVFKMSHQIPQQEAKDLAPCAKCFSKLVLLGENA